ncbi:GNAT family N-acetyltransferase [Flavobacterium sp.]|jgi:RimJ/RimL family protein N-acetyltransferase|uniref:GNAT family N-acetyltransferase n=1 Tax=Flavobacterium sp. TaxID=239 RepID=UPI0022CC0A2D|nr:GNAT family N-acetyltransferase [Flavobacterium sp.]MCZ8144091.1 GNAT family N-acetyltransferase [Flavobacterium sp.]MCZ8366288.1 GNAT family N-acetyltransferase [Flavobacterium sp.]
MKTIHMHVYQRDTQNVVDLPELEYAYHVEHNIKNQTTYRIEKDGCTIHESTVYNRLHFLGIIDKQGPTIGNCFTHNDYRGHGIYPAMLNLITNKLLVEEKVPEVFVIVDVHNTPSIKGIEKAGFTLYATVKTKRFLFFYLNQEVRYGA